MLTITIRSLSENKSIDIKINEKQKISNTIAVLEDAGLLKCNGRIPKVRSKRNRKRIDMNSTYQESNVFNGDILVLEYTDNK